MAQLGGPFAAKPKLVLNLLLLEFPDLTAHVR